MQKESGTKHVYTTEIADQVAADTNIPIHLVKQALDTAFEAVMLHVSEGVQVTLTGLGTFERRYMKPRKLADHLTKDEENVHDIPGHFRAGFRPGSTFRRLVRASA